MEKGTSWDISLLLEVLTQGEEQNRQLQAQLDDPSSAELSKSLAQQIQFTFNKAITMAKLIAADNSRQPPCPNNTSPGSPRSASRSPRSENSEKAFKEHEKKGMSKKRKSLPKWTSQVRISSGATAEGQIDDGFSWRKYGQKDILGAKYPRGYYRCTHRNAQGCPAKKLVQRSDADPAVFDITYWGRHICLQRPRVNSASSAPEAGMQRDQQNPPLDHDQQHPRHDRQLLLSFRAGLKVKTEGLDMEDQNLTSSSFSFPSTPIGSLKHEDQIFSSPPTLENNFMGSFSPNFFSPTTSESSYFSVPSEMDNYGGRAALHTSESDLTGTISAAASVTNFPMVDIDFMLEPHMDFEPNFPFDDSNLFR
ncbi:probable WRKY transcription factor 41 isoform X2 [Elaeis guineensis]|uniref:Probable WRKY transcription factor 41 isoform X2 n=1 Tax=Elaeis guineensis var. tenera TaxID=51953 RepID=A0A6I9RNC4_ELAGV|nr:probable WRKY transcription factor 41 isoform X2 [Elaeis guineensis]